MKALIVADVLDGDAEATARLGALHRAFDRAALAYETSAVAGPPAAGSVAANALRDGSLGPGDTLVSFGDDAAIQAVVDAMMAEAGPLAAGVSFGVMAAHATCDFVRTFGIPPDDAAFAAERVAADFVQPLDVARMTYLDVGHVERTSHFVGVAEIGLGGSVVSREARLPRRLGRARTFLAFWATQATFRVPEVRVTGERREFRGRVHEVVVGNCQWSRHGLRLSPRSFPGDGFLDLVIMTGPKSQAFTMLPRMFQGEHVPDPTVQEHRARHIRIECDRPLAVQADGVPLGTTPVTIELIPHALDLRI